MSMHSSSIEVESEPNFSGSRNSSIIVKNCERFMWREFFIEVKRLRRSELVRDGSLGNGIVWRRLNAVR